MFDISGSMDVPDTPTLARSRWSKRTGRLIEGACFLLLLVVIGTVMYGLTLRALWADGYYVVIAAAAVGAVVMLLSLAQQAIAARDAATWRAMAEWQIRAARHRIMAGATSAPGSGLEPLDPDSPSYYEHLVEALLDHVQRDDEKGARV
jgi:hypothetical protein